MDTLWVAVRDTINITTLAWTQISLILLVIISTVVLSEWLSAKARHAII